MKQKRDELIALRERKGLSQQNVADILEISRQTISKWENGEKKIPTQRKLELYNLYT